MYTKRTNWGIFKDDLIIHIYTHMLVEYGCDINVVYSINIHKYFLYPSWITNMSVQGGIIEYYM